VRKGAPRVLLQIALSLAALVILYFKIDVRHVLDLCRDLRWPLLAGIVATVLADRAMMAWKWNLLLRARGVAIPFREIFTLYYFSTFVGIFMPLAGDVARGVRLYRDGHGGSITASSIVIERMLGLAAGAVAAVAGSAAILLALDAPVLPLLVVSLAILVGFILFFALSLNPRLQAWVPFHQHALVRKLLSFHDSYLAYRQHRGLLLAFLALSVVEQIFPVLSHYFAGRALGLNVPFWVYLVTLPPVQLVARMPVSFNGLGVIEGMLGYVFNGLAYSATQGVTLGFVVDVVSLLTLAPAAFLRPRTGRTGGGGDSVIREFGSRDSGVG
jgi:uncharacterized membrane protein YbhN (UPF0104 family)